MSSLNQTYKELAIPFFREVFDCIDDIMRDLHIPCYRIGVNALALELLKEGIKPGRGTKDIDFAVMISGMDDYAGISLALESKGFQKVDAPWTFYSSAFGVAVDILPITEVASNQTSQSSQLSIDLHVLGFKEVLEEAVPVMIEDRFANVPPLPGMVILKLIAWSDRPEERGNDLDDILKIIDNYYDFGWDAIVEHHSDLLVIEPFDARLIGAEVLGREVLRFLNKSDTIAARIIGLLEANLKAPIRSAIARAWAKKLDTDLEYALWVLQALYRGIGHKV